MKTCMLIAFLLLGCFQKKTSQPVADTIKAPDLQIDTPAVAQTALVNDTTFLLREVTAHDYHIVYIEKDRNSLYYKYLTAFEIDTADWRNSQAYFRKNGVPIRHFKTKDLPAQWLPLYQYKGSYYLYAPSDWGNVNQRIVSDSLLIYRYIDGFYPYVITSLKKISRTEYEIKSKDYMNNEDVLVKPEELKITIIDPKQKIAVWAYKESAADEVRYRLFVPAANARHFDLIVNHGRQKEMEFEGFEAIDFKKLLAGK